MDRVQITAFDDDKAVLPEHVPGETILPSYMNEQHTDNMMHSIISFLERPQLISVFAWKNMSIDKHGQNILAFMDPSDASKTLLNPLVPSQVMTNMVLEKLQGFTSFRATAVFRLQVNSQPFQAGRLILGAVPMPTLLAERADFLLKTPCSALSINHVQLDINKQTEVMLRVPFISPFNSYDLINQQYDWAKLFCMVYAPLNVVGSDNSLNMELWCHFEDVELGCPTSAQCMIKPCFSPTRQVYWGDVVQQSGTVQIRPQKEVLTLEDLRLRKLIKRKDRERKYERDIKATQQSGWVPVKDIATDPALYTKGQYLGYVTYSKGDNGKKYTLNIPAGFYWVDVFTIASSAYGNATGFDTWSTYWSDSTLAFGGPMSITEKMTTFTVQIANEGVGMYMYFFKCNSLAEDINVNVTNTKLNVEVTNDNLDVNVTNDPLNVIVKNTKDDPVPTDGEYTLEQPVWVVDHDPDFPPSPPPSSPPPGEVITKSQSGKVPKKNTAKKTLRVPPKEAPPRAVKQQREKEMDGNFAKSVKSFAGKIGSAANSIGDVIASVGNWFGWSKPQIGHAGDTVVLRPCQYFGNVNGIDHSHVLSLDLLNNVDEYPNLTGTDLDELSFDFVKRIPQFIGAFQYNQANIINVNENTGVGNDYLWSCFVTPNYLNPACFQYQYSGQFGDDKATASNILKIQNPTSLAYAISPFTYWTGSLVYTFRFAKTDFNSGRVEISFHPFFYAKKYKNRNMPVPDNQRFEYAYRLVVDLRQNTEVSFTVPYVSPQSWKALTYYQEKYFVDPYTNPLGYSDLALNEMSRCSTGLLWVRALTPLHTQSAVAPTSVLCLVEVRAGDDFSVQCPAASRYMPIATSQAGRVYAVPGTQDTRTRALEGFQPPSIMGTDEDIEQQDTALYCAGETFDNYRSFIKRNMFIRQLSQYKPDMSVTLYPTEFISPPKIAVSIYQNKYDKKYYQIFRLINWPSPMSFTAAMYTFYRGGVRFKIVPTTASGGILSARLVQSLYDGIPSLIRRTTTSLNPYQTFNSSVHYEQNDKRICEFQVPYYSPTMQSVHWSVQGGYLFDNPLPHVEIGDSNVTSQLKSLSFFSISAAASDDFDLGLFLGAPMCISTRLYSDEFEYQKSESTVAEADWFQNGTSYDNIHRADPCHGSDPFNDGVPPSDFTKISTFDLPYSLSAFSVSNPDLTTSSDPGKVFKTGC